MNRNLSVTSTYEQDDPAPLSYQVQQYLQSLRSEDARVKRHMVIACIMCVALLAFEIFNFDTTRFALNNLIGSKSFASVGWATILAIAFCAIDFAGLIRLFTPETEDGEEPREVWYLMGAWLLGATMNAIMTWWAVSITLLNHDLGNEVLGRETLLTAVPIFVAVLVWLTRILFIGALTVTGEQLMERRRAQKSPGRMVRRPVVAASEPAARPVMTQRVPVRIVERGPNDPPSHRQRAQQTQQVVQQTQPVYYEADDMFEYVETVIEPEEIVQPKTQIQKRPSGAVKRPMAKKPVGTKRARPAPVKSGGLRTRPGAGIQARAKS